MNAIAVGFLVSAEMVEQWEGIQRFEQGFIAFDGVQLG